MRPHPIKDDEVVLLYPPVIGAPPDEGRDGGEAGGQVRVGLRGLLRPDVHGRPWRLPEPLELIDRDDSRFGAEEDTAWWVRPGRTHH